MDDFDPILNRIQTSTDVSQISDRDQTHSCGQNEYFKNKEKLTEVQFFTFQMVWAIITNQEGVSLFSHQTKNKK